MANTANYGWAKPTIGGDTGAWGGILNPTFDDIDADLKAVDDRVTELETLAIPGTPMLILPDGIASPNPAEAPTGQGGWFFNYTVASPIVQWVQTLDTLGQSRYAQPLRDLKPGMRVTAFASHANGQGTFTVELCYLNADRSTTVVSSGHSHTTANSTSPSTQSTSGLTHDVLAGKAYFLRLTPPGSPVVGDFLAAYYFQVTTIATP